MVAPDSTGLPVGVLALQGAYHKHIEMLSALGVSSQLIRLPEELHACSALIIPGGESTTMSLLIQNYGLYESLQEFARIKPVMGVCAGAILMSSGIRNDDNDQRSGNRVNPLNIMPFDVSRNTYGRQLNSFSAGIKLAFDAEGADYEAHFIRAPGFSNWSNDVKVVATNNNDAVMLAMGKHLALAFHPELTSDTRIHAYWLNAMQRSERINTSLTIEDVGKEPCGNTPECANCTNHTGVSDVRFT